MQSGLNTLQYLVAKRTDQAAFLWHYISGVVLGAKNSVSESPQLLKGCFDFICKAVENGDRQLADITDEIEAKTRGDV